MIVWCKNRDRWPSETWGFAERHGWLPPAAKRKDATRKRYYFELIVAGPDGRPLVTIRELYGLAYERARELAKEGGATLPDPSDPDIALLSVTGPTSTHRSRAKDLAAHLAKTLDGAVIDAPWTEQALEELKGEGQWVSRSWFQLWIVAFAVFFAFQALLGLAAGATYAFDLVTGGGRATRFFRVSPGACLFLGATSTFLSVVGALRLRSLLKLEEADTGLGVIDTIRMVGKGFAIWFMAAASFITAFPASGSPEFLAPLLILLCLGLLVALGPDNTFLSLHKKPLVRATHFLLLLTIPTAAYVMEFARYAQDLRRVERVLLPHHSSGPLGAALSDGHLLVVSEGHLSSSGRYTHLLSPEGRWLGTYKTPMNPGATLSFDPHRQVVWMTKHGASKLVYFFSLSDRTWYELPTPEGSAKKIIPTAKEVWLKHQDGLFVTVLEDKSDVWRKADPETPEATEVLKLMSQGPLPQGFAPPPCDAPVSAAVEDSRAYVACRHEGLWFSTDRGKTYRSLGLRSAEINYLRADFDKGEVLFTSQATLLFDGVFRLRT